MNTDKIVVNIPMAVIYRLGWNRPPILEGNTPDGNEFMHARAWAEWAKVDDAWYFRMTVTRPALEFMIRWMEQWRGIQSDDEEIQKEIDLTAATADKLKRMLSAMQV